MVPGTIPMKKGLISLLILSLLISPLVVVGAEARTRTIDPVKLQELGTQMIDKRVATITRYDRFLAQTKYISEPALTQVRGELSRVSGELGTLKTKILSETEIDVLKADLKSIITNYRVYQVFLPQSAGIVAVDRLRAFQAKLSELNGKISAKADELEGQGKDVTEIRGLVSTADGLLSTAEGHIATAESKFTSMTIADPEGSKTLKLEGRESLINARQSFSEARKNMQAAVLKIKELVQG